MNISGNDPEKQMAQEEKLSSRRKSRAECIRQDDLVESALFRRATGYEDAGGKEIPPDVRVALFWLKNRRPGKWGGEGKRTKDPPEDPAIDLSETETSL